MNTRTTWILLVIALALGAVLWFGDKQSGRRVTGTGGATVSFYPPNPEEVLRLEIQRSNQVTKVIRTESGWLLTSPIVYIAQPTSVEQLLKAINELAPVDFIPGKQVAAQPGGLGSFGLDQPTSITVESRGGRTMNLRVGSSTPLEGRFYLQVAGIDGVFVAESRVLAALPSALDDWRDRGLFDLRRTAYDRLEVQQRGKTVFEAMHDGQAWQLTKPLSARASTEALEALVNQLQTVRVTSFVSDGTILNPESFGLQPPESELVIGRGSNDLVRLKFGTSPTNALDQVYVQRVLQTNVVLVPTNVLSLVRLPLDTFRDRRLLPSLGDLSSLEVRGVEPFTVLREGTNWFVTQPRRFPANRSRVEEAFRNLEALEIQQYAADVIDNLSQFGLDKPTREYSLGTITNVAGVSTNVRLLTVEFGGVPTNNVNFVYTRRSDEPSVYSIVRAELARLPEMANQLRDWRYAVSNIASISIVHSNVVRELSRSLQGDWTVKQGTPANLISDALDETAFRLGEWNPYRYAVRDDRLLLAGGGYFQVAHEITLHFRDGTGPLRRWRLRFGREVAREVPALAYFDDDPSPIQVRFPAAIYRDVIRDFSAP